MSDLAFVDTNVVSYAMGASHLYRAACRVALSFASTNRDKFVSSSEVMQELLNIAVRRRDLRYASRAFEVLATACSSLEPVNRDDVLRALELSLPGLETRDLVHLAVMQRLGCDFIVSADRAFDAVPGITRLDPRDVELWRDRFLDSRPRAGALTHG